MTQAVEDAILALVAQAPAGKSIAPEAVARAVEPERWQRVLGHVRAVARVLARQGRIVILRHNKPADPETFKGVYRLRLPLPTDQKDPPP